MRDSLLQTNLLTSSLVFVEIDLSVTSSLALLSAADKVVVPSMAPVTTMLAVVQTSSTFALYVALVEAVVIGLEQVTA